MKLRGNYNDMEGGKGQIVPLIAIIAYQNMAVVVLVSKMFGFHHFQPKFAEKLRHSMIVHS